jgi:hypothetical protein
LNTKDEFQTDEGRQFVVEFFEYSDKSTQVKPSALKLNSVILVQASDTVGLKGSEKLTSLRTGNRYVIKEISNSGVGVFEITLERLQSDLNEAVTHGKF